MLFLPKDLTRPTCDSQILLWNKWAALQDSSRSYCTNKRSALGSAVRGNLGIRRTRANGRWAPGILPGFTQTIGIVTALLFLACVGLPSCRSVPSPSRCLVQLRPSLNCCCLLQIDKGRAIKKTNIWLSVWWKTKNQSWGVYTSHIHRGLIGGLQHLKIKTRLIDERFSRWF